jgi:hypothetical protein
VVAPLDVVDNRLRGSARPETPPVDTEVRDAQPKSACGRKLRVGQFFERHPAVSEQLVEKCELPRSATGSSPSAAARAGGSSCAMRRCRPAAARRTTIPEAISAYLAASASSVPTRVHARLLELVDAVPETPRTLVLDLIAVPDTDVTALLRVPALERDLSARGVLLRFENAGPRPVELGRRTPGLADRCGQP